MPVRPRAGEAEHLARRRAGRVGPAPVLAEHDELGLPRFGGAQDRLKGIAFLDQRENGMRRRLSERSHLLAEDRRCLATFSLDEAPRLVIVERVQHEGGIQIQVVTGIAR